jgi:CO/xanthine dehydrogenase Mo-binding subunit
MEPTGKINVYVNGGSTVNSLETTVIQLTADALGADIDDVATIQGDTAITPYGAGTQGSRSGPMAAGAVSEAGTILREKLVALAAHHLKVAESEVVLAHSTATARGDESKKASLGELPYLVYYRPQNCRRESRRHWRPPPATSPRHRCCGAADEYPAVALTLDAAIEVLSPRGRREIAAANFFTGLWETAMEPNEVLTGVRFPVWNSRSGFAVHEF